MGYLKINNHHPKACYLCQNVSSFYRWLYLNTSDKHLSCPFCPSNKSFHCSLSKSTRKQIVLVNWKSLPYLPSNQSFTHILSVPNVISFWNLNMIVWIDSIVFLMLLFYKLQIFTASSSKLQTYQQCSYHRDGRLLYF